MTHFEYCESQEHKRTAYSPNSFDLIEECEDCQLGFLFKFTVIDGQGTRETEPRTLFYYGSFKGKGRTI